MSIVACARMGDLAQLEALLKHGGGRCAGGGAGGALGKEPWSAQQGAGAADWLGRTALARASRYNRAGAIRCLLNYGARIDVVDVYGQSPLHVAAQRGHCEALAVLLGLDHGGGVRRAGGLRAGGKALRTTVTSACLPDRRYGLTPIMHFASALNVAAMRASAASTTTKETAVTISPRQKYILVALIAADLLRDHPQSDANAPKPSTTFKLRLYCCRLPCRQPTPCSSSAPPCEDPQLTYTPQDHASYHARGVHIFSHFASPRYIFHARARATHITASLHAQADPLRLYNLHQCGEQWIWHLASSPAVRRIVSYHCGNSFYFYISHLIAKPPRSSYAIPWHQDYRTKGSARHCSIWIALDDVDAENGGVRCVPGAHVYDAGRLRVQDIGATDFTSAIRADAVSRMKRDLSSSGGSAQPPGRVEMVLTLKAGQASMLHPLMPHYSPRNQSDRWRRGLLLRFAACSEHVAQSLPLGVQAHEGEAGAGGGTARCPGIFKDGSYFVDYRNGELFEACSVKMGAP